MRHRRWIPLLALVGLAAVAAGGRAQETASGQEGVEVLARGPVHEAFARPADPTPDPSPLVREEPPAPVEELPPEEKPTGDNVIWMPGYWDWDDDGDDDQFVWVSGFWRDAPPGRKWVPGFWQHVEGGWQRVGGFWADERQTEVEYSPPPPEPIEAGPSTPAPEPTSVYVPGCWIFRETRYFWRPGFWVPHRPGWVWVAANYTWTPRGHCFVEGYWDQPLHERGLLFAPVRIERRVIVQSFTYVPRYVVGSDFLLGALFVRPQARTYAFGDYFEQRYARRYVPWVDYRPARNVVDVNFNYYRHRFAAPGGREAGDNLWEQNLRSLYQARYRNEAPRPPRTLVQQTKVVTNVKQETRINQNFTINNTQFVTALTPVQQVNNTTVTALASLAGRKAGEEVKDVKRVVKVEKMDKEQRGEARGQAEQFRAAVKQRQQSEAKLAAAPTAEKPRAHKVELPKVPSAPVTRAAPTAPPKPGAPPPPRPAQAKEVPPAPKPPATQTTAPQPPRTQPPRPKDDKPATPRPKDDKPTPRPKDRDDTPPKPKPKEDTPPPKPKKEEPAPRPKAEEPPPKPKPKEEPPKPKPKEEPPKPKKEEPPPKPKKEEPPKPPPTATPPAPRPTPPPAPPAPPAPRPTPTPVPPPRPPATTPPPPAPPAQPPRPQPPAPRPKDKDKDKDKGQDN